MADRIEQEIEEILAKLDVDAGEDRSAPGRTPIPITGRRRMRPPAAPRSRRAMPTITPATLLLAGAAVMVVGLLASNWWEPLIWLSFAGVVLFLAAFAWSFQRHPRSPAGNRGPQAVYWRDRYIDVSPQPPGAMSRVRRMFRRH